MLLRGTTTGVVRTGSTEPIALSTLQHGRDSGHRLAGPGIGEHHPPPSCAYRFTTYERPEGARLTVVKRDGTRQEFDRTKLLGGLLRALEKRPVTIARAEQAVDDIESALRARGEQEVTSKEIGRLATEALRDIDQLAYIRFASVYHSYEDIGTLKREVDRLIGERVTGSEE
jgi:transcriptional repressor NrdR